jgi:hypothetical protein
LKSNDAIREFAAALATVEEELDWELLGRAYCDGDGSDFFDAELRERIHDTALHFVDDLAAALGGARGRSLYVGAALAELPVILAEHFVLGRRVEWLNIDGPEVRELARAVSIASAHLGLDLPAPRVRKLAEVELASCNHLWLVSVLTDPDSFPALHDELYERVGGELATGRGSLDDDLERARSLVDEWLDRAADPCLLTTTEEELDIVEARLAQRGWSLELAPDGRISAIVGDRVRMGRLRR